MDVNRFLYRLRCDGLMPHRAKMNLFARLLLETRIDFLSLVDSTASAKVSFRQSGIDASIDGVALGSLPILPLCVSLFKLNHKSVVIMP